MDRRFALMVATASLGTFAGTWAWLEGYRYYPGCSAARAFGAAPIRRGEPGYRVGMDGDGDGIACEPVRHRGFSARRSARVLLRR